MAKISQEQIKKINEKCQNGWRLDLQYFVFHSEKQLIKRIKIDEEDYLEFSLGYDWNNKIILRISKFYHRAGDDFATSSGLGKRKELTEQQKQKSISKLIEFTATLTDNELRNINSQTEVTKSPLFAPSKIF